MNPYLIVGGFSEFEENDDFTLMDMIGGKKKISDDIEDVDDNDETLNSLMASLNKSNFASNIKSKKLKSNIFVSVFHTDDSDDDGEIMIRKSPIEEKNNENNENIRFDDLFVEEQNEGLNIRDIREVSGSSKTSSPQSLHAQNLRPSLESLGVLKFCGGYKFYEI